MVIALHGTAQSPSEDLSYWEPLTTGIPFVSNSGPAIKSLQDNCPSVIGALWKLDETAGPVYHDYEGGHDITLQTGAVPTTGIVGGAQMFSMNTSMVVEDEGFDFEWQVNDNFSFEFWLKTTSSATMVVLGRYRTNNTYVTWWVGLADGIAKFFLRDNTIINEENPNGNLFEITGGPLINDNLWHHVVAVREGTLQENRLYVDGEEVAAVATDYLFNFSATDPIPITLGWFDIFGSNGYHFTGTLDEVAVFNKALSDEEVADFYGDGSPEGHCVVAPNEHTPVITSVPVTAAHVNAAYSYTVTAEDGDGTTVTLLSMKKPDWLNFDPATGVLSGTPVAQGNHEVIIRATDGTFNADQTFTIAVGTISTINDLEDAGIKIYPVPATTYLDLDLGRKCEYVMIRIINSGGSVIRSELVRDPDEIYRFDLGKISYGQYYIRINGTGLDVTGSFIVSR